MSYGILKFKYNNKEYTFKLTTGEFSDKHPRHKKFFGKYIEIQDGNGKSIARFSPFVGRFEFSKNSPYKEIHSQLKSIFDSNLGGILQEYGFISDKGKLIPDGNEKFRGDYHYNRVQLMGKSKLTSLYEVVTTGLSKLVDFIFKNKKNKKNYVKNSEETFSINEEVSEDILIKLVNIGLACIGCKTKYANKYMTLDVDGKRRAVERPFLTLLADRYKGAAQRTVVAKHFMIFKEMCLFISYSSLLKQDAELHDRVRTALKALLLDGLSQEERERHNEYWRVLSKNFYDAFLKTKSMKEALDFSFWTTLAMKYPEWVKAEDAFAPSEGYIFRIFRFSYDALKKVKI